VKSEIERHCRNAKRRELHVRQSARRERSWKRKKKRSVSASGKKVESGAPELGAASTLETRAGVGTNPETGTDDVIVTAIRGIATEDAGPGTKAVPTKSRRSLHRRTSRGSKRKHSRTFLERASASFPNSPRLRSTKHWYHLLARPSQPPPLILSVDHRQRLPKLRRLPNRQPRLIHPRDHATDLRLQSTRKLRLETQWILKTPESPR
jgi:hypothetical protein